MSTETVSPDKVESTRKDAATIQGEILRRLADVTQVHAAGCMGVSASTVSRMAEKIEDVSHLLAAIGLQVAPADAVVVDKEDQRALKRMAFNWLRADLEGELQRLRG
ncbi:transcriptional regulator [Herminiimonas sp. KBW02]|uniref:CII family transcriptional regulator n=1 Tax=Herminiimonas sp. KBW02 TaxID=2153363 RepID=UPI000F59E175|nr:CII family transcriptional regulator [Herminiimonas sp. KBW02]RQO38632.1 transcriptional regulator [Herminiimonas sp. KBW02]